jgi:hypothetical protein
MVFLASRHDRCPTYIARSADRNRVKGENKMFTKITKRLCAATLALLILCAATSTANAQFPRRTSGAEKAAIIGGGAAAGALLGGLLGGKKGAIIGGVVGAGGGTAYVYSRDRNADRYYDRYYSRDYTWDRNYYRYGRYNDWRYDRHRLNRRF